MNSKRVARSARALALRTALLAVCVPLPGAAGEPPVRDDPTLIGVENLQDPRTATSFFPKDREQKPDWVDVLRRGLIAPRETLTGKPRAPEFLGPPPAEGIVFRNTAQMPYVVFPHQPHTEWLACTNCHDDLFERRASGRGEGMVAIFMGRHCGTCHGSVAFSPIGSCYRCHSMPNPDAYFAPVPDAAIEPPKVDPDPEATGRRGRKSEVPLRQPSPPIRP